MPIDLHPEARRDFSEQAEKIRASLASPPPLEPQVPMPGSAAHRPVAATIEMDAEMQASWVERSEDAITGDVAQLEFRTASSRHAITSDGLKILTALVRQVSQHKALRDACSAEYVEGSLVEWLRQGVATGAPSGAWIDLFLAQINNDTRLRCVRIPLDGIAIEEEFALGAVRFGYFTAQYFEEMLFKRVEVGGEAFIEKVKKKYAPYQGVVYASFECVAEPRKAKERALFEVERALSLLRFFEPPILNVRLHSALGRKGALSPHQAHYFIETEGRLNHIDQETLRFTRDLPLTRAALGYLMRSGLAEADAVLRSSEPSELQLLVLRSMELFSSGMLSSASEHRLLHALVAVESLLLKDENESITGNIAFRVAHVAGGGDSLEGRKQIVRDMREAYGIRSGFVHHGRALAPENIDLANRTIRHCWTTVLTLLLERKYSTRGDLIRALDDRLMA